MMAGMTRSGTAVFTRWFDFLDRAGRLSESVRRAEQAGLTFAFRARSLAVAAVSLWLLLTVAWPRNGWYAGFCLAFFALGFVPYRLRRHRYAEAIKLGFVVLDVALVTVAILMPPPSEISVDWPVQIRLRGHFFVLLELLLAEAALTYSPRRVLWTGASIMAVWSVGFAIINALPDTLRYFDVVRGGPLPDAALLRMYVDPHYVSVASWATQLVGALLFTLLLTLAVWRSRRHLLAEVRAEVARSDLARYVSPDIAEAVLEQAEKPDGTGFGEPASRDVAVMFADIVGFTGYTEQLAPDRTFALLRSFQERSARSVLDHGGTLDKYLGDGLMVTFGALRDDAEAPARAIACAFALLAEVERWNTKRQARAHDPIRVAVGVHCGRVMVGHLGSAQRIEFTVVGNVVNVASRLEKATRELGCLLVASDDCVSAAGAARFASLFERTVELRLRGRSLPLAVHCAGRSTR